MYVKRKGWLQSLFAMCLAAMLVVAGCSDAGTGPAPEDAGTKTTGEAGGETGGETSESTDDPYASLPRSVSISMFDRGQVSSDEGTYEDNRWVKWIREQSGIDVKIVPVPRNQAQDTLNVLIASDQAPDLIWEYDRTYIGKLVSQGAIQPIGDYIEKYSTTYKQYLADNPDLLPYVTFDGEMYAVTTKRAITSVANHAMWIRQDWLDAVNLPMPTTDEELIEVAKAFKAKFPDSTPVVGYTSSDVYAAMYGASNYLWYLEDGQMSYGATLDRYADAVNFEKRLYENGLMDREFLTDSNNQRANQLWTTGKAGIFLAQWGGGNVDVLMKDLLTNDPAAKPVPLEAVGTKYGRWGLFQESPPNIYVAFNKNMKNPKAALEYLDWILRDGWFTLFNGFEGEHYNMVNGLPQVIDTDKYNKEALYAREYAVLRQEEVKPQDLVLKAAQDPMSQRIAELAALGLETALKHPYKRDIPYQPSFDELNEIRSTLDKFVQETRAKAVTQGEQFTGEWAVEQIRNEWNRLGGEEAQKIAQQWYEENKATFK